MPKHLRVRTCCEGMAYIILDPAPGKEGKKVEKQSKRKQGEVDDK